MRSYGSVSNLLYKNRKRSIKVDFRTGPFFDRGVRSFVLRVGNQNCPLVSHYDLFDDKRTSENVRGLGCLLFYPGQGNTRTEEERQKRVTEVKDCRDAQTYKTIHHRTRVKKERNTFVQKVDLLKICTTFLYPSQSTLLLTFPLPSTPHPHFPRKTRQRVG